MARKTPKVAPTLEVLRADARAEYALDAAAEADPSKRSPARATTALAERYGIPRGPLVGLVAEVYYEGNGAAVPLDIAPLVERKTPAARARAEAAYAAGIAEAVRARRDARGHLGRWEVIRYAYAAALDLDPSARPTDDAIRALYARAGGDLATSYTGRGTRKGVPATRVDAAAYLAEAADDA